MQHDILPQEYEDSANQWALEKIMEWSSTHTVPKISEMGWATGIIAGMLTQMYANDPNLVKLEMLLDGTAADVNAKVAHAVSWQYKKEIEIGRLLTDIRESQGTNWEFGIISNGVEYLRAHEALALNYLIVGRKGEAHYAKAGSTEVA